MGIGKVIQRISTTFTSLRGVSQPQMMKGTVQNLTHPNLIAHVPEISKTLSISKKETKSILSLYEQYLKNSHSQQNIDFSKEGIERYIIDSFFSDAHGSTFVTSKEIRPFIKLRGFDILKDIIRTGTSRCSVEGAALHHDLKYLGLDSKSAKIVEKFEQNGINLITSSENKELNKLFGGFLDKINKEKLPKIKTINLMGHDMSNQGVLAQYNHFTEEINMNPLRLNNKKSYCINLQTGKKFSEKDDFENFIHEYFHFMHHKALGKKYLELRNKSLFEYLVDKKYPNLSSYIDDINNEGFMLINDIREQGKTEDLDKFITVIRNNADEIFKYHENPKEAMQAIENAYNETKEVAKAIGSYSTATVLETVAEGGSYRYFGRKIPEKIDDLLSELQCPKLNA